MYNVEHPPPTPHPSIYIMRNISPSNIPPPTNVNVADQIRVSVRISWVKFERQSCFSVFFKLILEIRVSVRIFWENFNANRVFSINLNIFDNFHFQKIEGDKSQNPPSGSAPGHSYRSTDLIAYRK